MPAAKRHARTLPVMRTSRLRLVPYGTKPATVAVYCRITTHPQVYWWRRRPYTREEQTAYFRNGGLFEDNADGMGYWAVFRIRDGQPLGQVILQPLEKTGLIEIGWHFLPEARGHGYATEAAHRLARYGFDKLGIDPIYAVIRATNRSSRGVARRLGMRQTGKGHYYGHEHLRFRLDAADMTEGTA